MGTALMQGRSTTDLDPLLGSRGKVEELKSVFGRFFVTQGSGGQAHNRNITAASTTYASATNSVTWSTAVTDFEIAVPAPAGLTGVLVVYGAYNDAQASAWLADLGSISSDVTYDLVLPNSVKSRQLSAGITRIDVLPLGANTRIVIGAV